MYQIANKTDSRKIAEFLAKDGQSLLPFLDLICNTEQAADELIDVVGKGAIEAVEYSDSDTTELLNWLDIS